MASNHPAASSDASSVATYRNKNNHEWPVQAPAPTKPYMSRRNTGRTDVSNVSNVSTVSTLYYTEDEIKAMGYRPFEYWTPPKTSRKRPPSISTTSRSRSRSVSRAATSRRNSSKASSLNTVVDVESQLDEEEEEDVYHRLEADHKIDVDHTIDVVRNIKIDLHPKIDPDEIDDVDELVVAVARPREVKEISATQRFYLGDREPPPSSPRVKDRVKARKAAQRRARRERRHKRASLGEWLGWQPDNKVVARLRRGEGLFVAKERWRNPRSWRRRTWGFIAAVLLSMLVLGLLVATMLVKEGQHTAREEFVLVHARRA